MKTVCFVTSTRADYGLLKPLMDKFKNDENVRLEIVATGTHLSKRHGRTINEIRNDGFVVNEHVEIMRNSDSAHDICLASGKAVSGVSLVFERLKPDVLVLLGDRFEILMAAIAATVHKIPVVHLHGGELTEGAMDEVFRHSITKMSQLHFTSTPLYRDRVIQLGENPERVWCTGAIGVENALNIRKTDKTDLFNELEIPIDKPLFLVTYHPETLGQVNPQNQIEEVIEGLNRFDDAYFLFTSANADTAGDIINSVIETFVRANPNRAKHVSSLGYLRYLNFVRYSAVVIGNSSSGIIEVPSFHVPTVNIGDRQKGRLSSESVINVICEADEIDKAINKALDPEFRNKCKCYTNPYEGERPSETIYKIVKNELIEGISITKKFYDISECQGDKG